MSLHESLQFQRPTTSADIAAGERVCPVCSRETNDEFVPLRVLSDDIQKLIRANAPDTNVFEAVCARCVRLFETLLALGGRFVPGRLHEPPDLLQPSACHLVQGEPGHPVSG